MAGLSVLTYPLLSLSPVEVRVSGKHPFHCCTEKGKNIFSLGGLMEATASPLSSSSTVLPFASKFNFYSSANSDYFPKLPRFFFSAPPSCPPIRTSTSILPPSALFLQDDVLDASAAFLAPSSPSEMLPKFDKSGRFCSPRAARELALLILYASCLEGSDPVRLFDKRVNARWESGYQFDKDFLLEYNHMSFGGPPVKTDTIEEANELLSVDQKESDVEAEVLSAPPKLVYSKLILRFTRKLLVAVAECWNSHVLVIDKVAPYNWKKEPAWRILELSLLHLAMSEIAVLGTRHQIVINEAVDLAKRFCDGAAPRIVNGCLRTFVKDFKNVQ